MGGLQGHAALATGLLARDLIEVGLVLRHHVQITDEVGDLGALRGGLAILALARRRHALLPRVLPGALAVAVVVDLLRLRELTLVDLRLIDERPARALAIVVLALLRRLRHGALGLPVVGRLASVARWLL